MSLAAFVNRSKSHAKLVRTCSIQLASANLALDSKTFFAFIVLTNIYPANLYHNQILLYTFTLT